MATDKVKPVGLDFSQHSQSNIEAPAFDRKSVAWTPINCLLCHQPLFISNRSGTTIRLRSTCGRSVDMDRKIFDDPKKIPLSF